MAAHDDLRRMDRLERMEPYREVLASSGGTVEAQEGEQVTITHGAKTITLRRIAIGPVSYAGLSDYATMTTLERLEERARSLGVNVSTHGRGLAYTVTVVGNGRSIDLKGEGDLLAIIAGALDDYEAQWTPEEILTVAAQSGIEVQRA